MAKQEMDGAKTRIAVPTDQDLSRYPEILTRGSTKSPKTRRGDKTRANVLDAARDVFAKDGYDGARVSDITDAAGLALGTFYGYFDDKADVFAAVLESVYRDLYDAARSPYLQSDGPSEILRASLRDYLIVYFENRDIMRALMQAVAVDERFASVHFEVRSLFVARIRRNLERAQQAGLSDPMNPLLEASALGGMVENFCWTWFAMGGEREQGTPMLEEISLDDMVEVLTKLWTSALFGKVSVP